MNYDWDKINKTGNYSLNQVVREAGDYQSWLDLVPNKENNWKINFTEIEKRFSIWVKAMKICPQEPDFHAEGDVWTHTKMVMEWLVNSNEYQRLNSEKQEILFFTALMHDIGKPFVTTLDNDSGRITSKGHSARGAKDARITLYLANAPVDKREIIANIISVHQMPFVWIKKANVFSLRETSQFVPLDLLYIMALSDANGRLTKPIEEKFSVLEKVELFKAEAEFQNCFDKAWSYPFEHLHAERLYWEGMGDSVESRVVHWEKRSDVIMLAGMPASGKDTWCAIHAKDNPIISLDAIREELGIKYSGNKGYAIQLMTKRAKELLANNTDFVWNATHLSDSQRNKTLRLLRAYGATVRMVYIENDLNTLLQRNNKRDTTLSNERLIELMYKWEPPKPTEAHEVMWWLDNKPTYMNYITTKEDTDSPWKFIKKSAFKF